MDRNVGYPVTPSHFGTPQVTFQNEIPRWHLDNPAT